jgi:glycogen synthase
VSRVAVTEPDHYTHRDTRSAGLRILAVGNMYPPHHAGGYELVWQAAMRHARAQGHQARVVTSDYRQAADREEDDPDVHRTLLWYWDLEHYRFAHQKSTQSLRVERHNAAELRRHLRDFRPDVVAWWSMGCMSLSLIEQARRASVPAVFIVHDDWLAYGWQHDAWMRTWGRRRRKPFAPIVERVCGVPTAVEMSAAGSLVFNSRYTLERARQAGVDVTRATVVHPGIDARFLEPVPPQPWRWRLSYVGRIDRQKGIDTAVSALAHLPPTTTLTVWGSGDESYVAELKALADRIGAVDRVRFEGFATADALPSVYADADVVVFPVRWEEPFGLVPLEAMGMGRPVATTVRGGTAEFVRDGANALVFEPGDAAGLAGCLDRLARDEALRLQLREGGLVTAAEYTSERFAQRTLEEIVRAAERARPRPGRSMEAPSRSMDAR